MTPQIYNTGIPAFSSNRKHPPTIGHFTTPTDRWQMAVARWTWSECDLPAKLKPHSETLFLLNVKKKLNAISNAASR